MDAHALFQIFCVSQILHILFYMFFSPYLTISDILQILHDNISSILYIVNDFFQNQCSSLNSKSAFAFVEDNIQFNQGDWFDDNIWSVNLSIASNIIWTSNYTLIEILLTKNHLSAWKIRTKTI